MGPLSFKIKCSKDRRSGLLFISYINVQVVHFRTTFWLARSYSEVRFPHCSSSIHTRVVFLITSTVGRCSYKSNNWRWKGRERKPRETDLARWGKLKCYPCFFAKADPFWQAGNDLWGRGKNCIYAGRNVINCHATFKSLHCFFFLNMMRYMACIRSPAMLQDLHAGDCMRQINIPNML